MPALTLAAPAKINLYLHVTGKRADGYHLLDSMVVFAKDFGDRLSFEAAEGFSLTCTGPFAKLLADGNLIEKSARAYYGATGIKPGCHIHLEKNIPVGAGLGGGSADAAAAVNGLEQLHGVSLPPERRNALLLELGADVPVCYHGKPCRFQGIGELILDVPPLPGGFALLIWPNIPLATKDVFAGRSGPFDPPAALPVDVTNYDFLNTTTNGLAAAAETICSLITSAKKFLASQEDCLLARMSGSGSCVFGLFNTAENSRKTADICRKTYPDWWIQPISF